MTEIIERPDSWSARIAEVQSRQVAAREGAARQEYASLLLEDPDLGRGLSEEDARAAAHLLRAPVIAVGGPVWQPRSYDGELVFGLLILDGLIGRRLRVGSAVSMELLGPGDVVRPWEESVHWTLVEPELDWCVFAPARLALLDERVTQVIARRPQLVIAFSGRLLRRARSASYLSAITHLTRVEDRLLATLWHLASTWGRVTPLGVRLPFRLTHQVLGEIVGAQRPSVSASLQRLQARGQLERGADGTLMLTGSPDDWKRGRVG